MRLNINLVLFPLVLVSVSSLSSVGLGGLGLNFEHSGQVWSGVLEHLNGFGIDNSWSFDVDGGLFWDEIESSLSFLLAD
jgi:hypothetical protein